MSEPSKKPEPNKKEYIPGDDGFTRWRNTLNLLLGRLSDEGVAQYIKKRDDRFEEEDCRRCEQHRDWLLQYSQLTCPSNCSLMAFLTCHPGPIVRFMRQKINALGSDVHNRNIRCRRCYTWQGGGFDPTYGILLCANRMHTRSQIEDTMAHGMPRLFLMNVHEVS